MPPATGIVAAALIGAPPVAWDGNYGLAGCDLGALDPAAQPEFGVLTQEQHPKQFAQDPRTKTGLEQVKAAVSTAETLRAFSART